LFSISTLLIFLNGYTTIASGNYLYYFPLATALVFLFDNESNFRLLVAQILLMLLSLSLSLIASEWNWFNSPTFDAVKIDEMFLHNLVISVLVMGFFIFELARFNMYQIQDYNLRIEKQKHTEKIIQQSLKEKELLLSELHHRVKNNLALISSLINLEISNTNGQVISVEKLEDIKSRIKSLAIVHDKLYKSKDIEKIRLDEYVSELSEELKSSFFEYPNIHVETNLVPCTVHLDKAIPCGLILNEVITNAYKHGFCPGNEAGLIEVTLSKKNEMISIVIQDNGKGIKADFNISSDGNLGTGIVYSLTEQLGGKSFYRSEKGTRFEIEFAA
jgi:two-component sensor histidine kinase